MPVPSLPNGSLTLEELELYHLIMDYRASEGLPPIEMSAALTATAGYHTYDTLYNIWDAGLTLPPGANLHSWSDAFYYSDHRDPEVMWDAPDRIGVSYPSSGYEISAAGFATIEGALAGWQGSPSHNNVILNLDIWTDVEFNAIGVGVAHDPSVSAYQGDVYHVWFGESVDPAGPPQITGTDGADQIRGTAFDDNIVAGAGDDQVWAGPGDTGNDLIYGGSGNDTLGGGAGDDTLFGGFGEDVLFGGPGNDDLYGEAGSDVIWAGPGNDLIHGGTENDTLGGGQGADSVFAGAGADVVYGSTEADIVHGEAGNDTLFGGDGDDTILGGAGDDEMYSGAGTDVFVFEAGHGNDSIGGFETNGDNTIDVSALGLSGFSDLSLSQEADGVVVQTGEGSITLWGTVLTEITADDFIF